MIRTEKLAALHFSLFEANECDVLGCTFRSKVWARKGV